MARTARLSSLLIAGLLMAVAPACALETVGPGPDNDTDTTGDPNPNPDPLGDEELGLLCEATLAVTGTLTPDGSDPGVLEGCVPYGTWTVNVEVADPGDCAEVPVAQQYTYYVTPLPDEGGFEYQFADDPDDPNVYMKITEGGPGDCEGTFQHYSADGTQMILLKPHERDLSITGQGYYELWETSQL